MATMTTAAQLARFLAAEYPDRGAAWAMKVVYYIQGWRLAWEGVPAFPDPIEAWDLGPVAPSAYAEYGSYQASALRPPWTLPTGIEAIARSVADHLHRFGGTALIRRTHSEPPWSTVYGTVPSFNSRGTNPIIEQGEMRTYFTQLAALDEEIPKRPGTPREADSWEIDIDELDAFTAASSKRWATALDLLSK